MPDVFVAAHRYVALPELREARMSSLGVDRECCICGTSEDLRIAPIMTGDKFGEEPQWPVCGACIRAWYESGETTADGIRRHRLREVVRG